MAMGKNPKKVAAGKIGAVKRWGGPRVVRLEGLTSAQRDLVLALIATFQERDDPDLKRRLAERLAEREAAKESSAE